MTDFYPLADVKTGFIYFYSPSCAPCRQMTPLLKKMEKTGTVSGRFVDVSVDMKLARALGIIGTPAIVFVQNGVIADVVFGMQSESVLGEKFDSLNTGRR